MAHLAVLALLAGLVLQCATVPRRYYYALSYPMAPPTATADRPPLHPFRVRIRPFRSALPYNRPEMVYRESQFEFRYYVYRMWAAKPQHMLRELVERHLDTARLTLEVTRDYGEKLPDYELSAEVLAIEEYDSGDLWYGHLAMRFQLVRFADKVPIWNYSFDRKRKVFIQQPVYVVRALSGIIEEELDHITAALDHVLSEERGVAPTLPLAAPPRDDDERPAELPSLERHPKPDEAPLPSPEREPFDPDELIMPDELGSLPPQRTLLPDLRALDWPIDMGAG